MLDDLPPDRPRLLTLRTWHAIWVQRIDAKIAALDEQQAQQERVQQARREPEWVVELGIGAGRPDSEVHAGGCYAAGKRQRPISRDEARRLLASGIRACSHCTPDTALGIDLPSGRTPSTAAHRPAAPHGRPRFSRARRPPAALPGQDAPHAQHSPAPDQRTGPLHPLLLWQLRRKLLRLPAAHPSIRQRRTAPLSVVPRTRAGEVGIRRALHQRPRQAGVTGALRRQVRPRSGLPQRTR